LFCREQEFLDGYYKKRAATKEARIQEHRQAHELLERQGASGESEWERAISLIDFNFTRPSGTDLSRLRGVLFAAKSKPVAA